MMALSHCASLSVWYRDGQAPGSGGNRDRTADGDRDFQLSSVNLNLTRTQSPAVPAWQCQRCHGDLQCHDKSKVISET